MKKLYYIPVKLGDHGRCLAEYHHGADIQRFENIAEQLPTADDMEHEKVLHRTLLMKCSMQDYPLSEAARLGADKSGKPTAASLTGGAPSP